jgi:hypothetical protein
MNFLFYSTADAKLEMQTIYISAIGNAPSNQVNIILRER